MEAINTKDSLYGNLFDKSHEREDRRKRAPGPMRVPSLLKLLRAKSPQQINLQ